MPDLRLRPLELNDEVEFMAAHQAMLADGFNFAFDRDVTETWAERVRRLDIRQYQESDEFVPATFLVAVVNSQIVGRISIRHRLNEFLSHEGGHIGYGVLPTFRRKGYATEMLRQGLIVARACGVDRALVTCNDANIGSAAVIEKCGGKLENVVTSSSGERVRRYWID